MTGTSSEDGASSDYETSSEVDVLSEYEASVSNPDKELNKHLCIQCRRIFHKLHEAPYREVFHRGEALSLSHHNNVDALEQSAKTGCPICVLLFENFAIDTIHSLRNFCNEYESKVRVHCCSVFYYHLYLDFEACDKSLGASVIHLENIYGEKPKGE